MAEAESFQSPGQSDVKEQGAVQKLLASVTGLFI
jgi:hypothetical protein